MIIKTKDKVLIHRELYSSEDTLCHYGREGMRWGKHIYGDDDASDIAGKKKFRRDIAFKGDNFSTIGMRANVRDNAKRNRNFEMVSKYDVEDKRDKMYLRRYGPDFARDLYSMPMSTIHGKYNTRTGRREVKTFTVTGPNTARSGIWKKDYYDSNESKYYGDKRANDSSGPGYYGYYRDRDYTNTLNTRTRNLSNGIFENKSDILYFDRKRRF